MNKIIVISDTHGNQKLLRKALSKEENISHIFHLGDNYEDIENNLDLTDGKIIYRVPGIYHSGYITRKLPAILEINIEDKTFFLVHNIQDIVPINLPPKSIVLFGHSHHPELNLDGNVFSANPGHLKKDNDRNSDASYLVIEISKKETTFKLKNIWGDVFKKDSIK